MFKALLFASFLLAGACPGQRCPDQGSRPVPAAWESGPPLGCPHAPEQPAWYLFTPRHRRVVPKSGWRQGRARPRWRLLRRMECTGLWTVPATPVPVRVMGYVLDVREERCGG